MQMSGLDSSRLAEEVLQMAGWLTPRPSRQSTAESWDWAAATEQAPAAAIRVVRNRTRIEAAPSTLRAPFIRPR